MQSGIYKISSLTKPKRFYIGSAINLKRRKTEHFRRLASGSHPNIILLRHFKKHGYQDLIFSIIETCPESELITKEQEYIDKTNPYFNICKVAGSALGRPQSEETRRKRGLKLIGRNMTNEDKQAMREAALNRYAVQSTIINGFKVVNAEYKLRSRQSRLILFECPYCHGHIVRTKRDIQKIMHCGCVKPSKLPTPVKVRQIRIDQGVSFRKDKNKWIARATTSTHGRQKFIGYYNTIGEAIQARAMHIQSVL